MGSRPVRAAARRVRRRLFAVVAIVCLLSLDGGGQAEAAGATPESVGGGADPAAGGADPVVLGRAPMGTERLVDRFTYGHLYVTDLLPRVCGGGDVGCQALEAFPTAERSARRVALIPRQGRRVVALFEHDGTAVQARVDLDGDGELIDETPRPLTPQRNRIEFLDQRPPFALGLPTPAPGFRWPERVELFVWTERAGALELGDRRVRLAVLGLAGRYDDPVAAFYVDVDGDGAVDTRPRSSPERFPVAIGRVPLGELALRLQVAADGAEVHWTAGPADPPADLAVGAAAPPFELTGLEGERLYLEGLRGEVVLLHAWASWCVPCARELPLLLDAYDQLQVLGVEFVGVNATETEEVARRYLEQRGMAWPQALGDEGRTIASRFGFRGIPEYVLIDRDGRIVARELRGPGLIRALRELAEGAVTAPTGS